MLNDKIMNNEKDRDRDNASGKFVSDEFADAHKDSTTSEEVKPDPLRQIFKRLDKQGGSIVRGSEGETFEAYERTYSYLLPTDMVEEPYEPQLEEFKGSDS